MPLRTVFLCNAILAAVVSAQTNVVTANYGNGRSNANLQETTLSRDTISPNSFGKIGTFSVDGQVYAQPLYVSSLSIPGQGAHDVVFVATMHDSVYAFDAGLSPATPLWHVNLGPSVPSSFLNVKDAAPEIGILSTGVIDLSRNALYILAETFENGACVFRLHALDLTTGQEILNGPVVISAQVVGTGEASVTGLIAFDPHQHLQRPGLLLLNGSIYAAFGSHQDNWPFHGWLMRYDASNLQHQIGVFMTTPNAAGGSIWQSGRGPAADESGNIYVITGNGDYDGQPDLAESFLKLSAAPSILDWFTPDDWQELASNDYDMSAGPALVPGTHLVLGGDKYGTLYLVNGDSMGRLSPSNAANVQSFQAVRWGGIFTFALWSRPDATYVYVQEQGSSLLAYRIVNGQFEPTPFSASAATTSIPYDGIAVSANGGQEGTGIVWETTGNFQSPGVPGTLHVFDASDLTNELWNSDMNPKRDALGAFAKFVSPTVVNGRVYVPTFSNQVAVYGLISGLDDGDPLPVISSILNAASFVDGPISPGAVISVSGSYFGPQASRSAQIDSPGVVANMLGDTQVLFDGNPAPVLSVGPNQATVVAPFVLQPGPSQVQVQYAGQQSDPFMVTVAPLAPALYSANGSGTGQGLIVNEDGSANTADTPASAGSVVMLYATGTGPTDPAAPDGQVSAGAAAPSVAPVSVYINGLPAEVVYAGAAPGLVAGIVQVNARVPAGISGAALPVFLQVRNSLSQTGVTIAVQ